MSRTVTVADDILKGGNGTFWTDTVPLTEMTKPEMDAALVAQIEEFKDLPPEILKSGQSVIDMTLKMTENMLEEWGAEMLERTTSRTGDADCIGPMPGAKPAPSAKAKR